MVRVLAKIGIKPILCRRLFSTEAVLLSVYDVFLFCFVCCHLSNGCAVVVKIKHWLCESYVGEKNHFL